MFTKMSLAKFWTLLNTGFIEALYVDYVIPDIKMIKSHMIYVDNVNHKCSHTSLSH